MHDFNMHFRDYPQFKVIAFTATQIPGIEKRSFPRKLAGKYYKKDIPIYSESKLPLLIQKHDIDYVILRFFNIYGIGQSSEYAGVITKFIKKIRENFSIDNYRIMKSDKIHKRCFLPINPITINI